MKRNVVIARIRKKHEDYCVIDKFQLPNNINNIYTYAHKCNKCKNRDEVIERIDNFDTLDNEFKVEHEKLNLLSCEHYRELRKIKTKNWIPIKHAMMKFYDESDEKDIDMYEYRRKKMIQEYENILHIQKHGKRYMCSEERLNKIDFDIMEAAKRCYRNWHC